MSKDRLIPLLRPSTKLPGRDELRGVLEETLRHSRDSRAPLGVMLFSLDRFRLVNQHFGHDQADEVLRRVGAQSKQALRHKGIVGLWGGDEYMAILPGLDAAGTLMVAEQLRGRIANFVIPVGRGVTTVTCSFGVATYPDEGESSQRLVAAADEALYEAKQAGRNRVVHAGGLVSPVLRLAAEVETAVRENRIMPAYQPIYDLESGGLVAEEALARLITPDERILAAHEFIEAASQLQLTHKIDRIILEAALGRAADNLLHSRKLALFTNISPNLLRQPEQVRNLIESVRAGRGIAGANNPEMVLEITERELLGEAQAAREWLAPFVELGFKLALDDFGSGYSSFQYLADLPISYLKIDGRLIQRLQESRVRAIVRGIHLTALDLGLVTMAEHVESDRQANILREIGVHWAQGHFFSRAALDEREANARRRLSVNWAQGYYYRRPNTG